MGDGYNPLYGYPGNDLPQQGGITGNVYGGGGDPQGYSALMLALQNGGVDIGGLMQLMAGQGQTPVLDAGPTEGAGYSGTNLPASASAPLAPSYRPSAAASTGGADPFYAQGPEVALPRPKVEAPKTKMDWIQALMPAILAGVGGAVSGTAGVAGALKGWDSGQQQDILNAQRQQQIDQQRAILASNERRYAEMDRLRQENNDRLKASTGSQILQKALNGAAQLNSPEAQAAYVRAHAAELAPYGYDLNQFVPEISARAKQRYQDWAKKALDDAVTRLQKIHGPAVDLGPYFGDNPPAKIKTDNGALSLKDLAIAANIDPNEYVTSPDELKQRQGQNFTAPVQVQVDDQVATYKETHQGQDPPHAEYAKMVAKAQQIAGDASRAPTTIELAQEMAGANALPEEESINFLSGKSGLSAQELRTQAEIYARGGDLTNMGFGGVIPRTAIMTAQGKLYPYENLAKNKSELHAHRALLDQQVKASANLNQFEDAANLNLDFAEKMRAKAPDLGGQFWNTPVQSLLEKGFGDADVKAARAALANASREVQRIVTDPLLRGHLTIYASKKADEILPPTATLNEVQAVMAVMRKDMANVSESVNNQLQQNQNWMNRPLMGADNRYHDRQGNEVQVNSDGLLVDAQGQVVNLDNYGRAISSATPQTPTGPPPGAGAMSTSRGRAAVPMAPPAAAPAAAPPVAAPGGKPAAAARPPGAAPGGPTVFDALNARANAKAAALPPGVDPALTVRDPATGKVRVFPTKEAAAAFAKLLASQRGF